MTASLIPVSVGLGMLVTALCQISTGTLQRRRRRKALAARRARQDIAWNTWCLASIRAIREGRPVPPYSTLEGPRT